MFTEKEWQSWTVFNIPGSRFIQQPLHMKHLNTFYYLNIWFNASMSFFKPKDTQQALSRKESAVNMEKFKKFAARRKWKVLFFFISFLTMFCYETFNYLTQSMISDLASVSIMCHTNKSHYFHTNPWLWNKARTCPHTPN